MDLTDLIRMAAPLLAGMQLFLGLDLLLRRQALHERLPQRQQRNLGTVLTVGAVLWAVLAGIGLANGATSALQLGLAILPWVTLAVAGVWLAAAWSRRPVATVRALQAFTDPRRIGELPRDMRPFAGRLRSLARRITTVGTVETIFRLLFVGAVVAAVWLLVDRLLTATAINETVGLAAPPVIGLAAGLAAGWLLSRATPAEAAVKADLTLNLRERLATALAVNGESPFEVAVRRDALDQLRSTGWERVAPFRWPWQGSAVLGLGALLAIGFLWLPTVRLLDQPDKPGRSHQLFGNRSEALEVLTTNRRQLEEIVEKVGNEDTRQLMKEIGKIIEDLRHRPQQQMTPDEQREMIEKLSHLEDEAERMQKELDAMQRDSQALRNEDSNDPSAKDSPVDKMQNDLGAQDYRSAAEQLEDMKKQMQELQDKLEQDPDSEESKQLRDKMQKMGQKMQELADKLSQQNPLKQPMDQLADKMQQPDLTPEQLKQLQQQMQQLQQQLQNQGNGQQQQLNQQMLEMLKDQLFNCQGCMGQQGTGKMQGMQPGQGQQGGMSPSDQQRLQKMMEQMQQGQGQQGGNGQPGNQGGQPGTQPGGTGGERGGGSAPGETNPDALQQVPWMQKGKLQKSDIIAAMRRYGIPPAGEARAQFEAAWEAAQRQAEDSMTRQSVPPEYRPLARRYFDSIHPRTSE